MSAAIRVCRAGLLSTVQDLGRPQAARYGVPLGGAMDRFALIAANRLVENAPGAAALEITTGDAVFEILVPLLLATTGADLAAALDDQALPAWTAVYARAGQMLSFGQRQWGARAYLTVAGGIDVPEVLGARGTSLGAGFGGLAGRPLRAGDMLPVGATRCDISRTAGRAWPAEDRPAYSARPALRILPGPQLDLLPAGALAALTAGAWRVGAQSNRMGYRLEGSVVPHPPNASIPSHGVVPGTIQLPPDGAPIMLMADAQTTGGYPIIAVVIGADLPVAAQLLPGDQLHFETTTPELAVDAWRTLIGWQERAVRQDDVVEQLAWAEAADVVSPQPSAHDPASA